MNNDPSREAWHRMSADEQAAAIVRLADAGHSDSTIAQATALSIEQVRQVIGARREKDEAA